MKSVEAAMCLLRVNGTLNQTSSGGSQASLLHEFVLPAATYTSVHEAAMRLLRAEGTYTLRSRARSTTQAASARVLCSRTRLRVGI